jgi:hypothetical protein
MLFTELITIYFKDRAKYVSKICEESVQYINVAESGEI